MHDIAPGVGRILWHSVSTVRSQSTERAVGVPVALHPLLPTDIYANQGAMCSKHNRPISTYTDPITGQTPISRLEQARMGLQTELHFLECEERMQLGWNPTQLRLRDQYAAFGQQVAERANLCYDSARFDHSTWDNLAKLGIWRLPVPEEYGGLGMTWWEFAAAFEGLATTAKDLGFLLSMVAHVGSIRVLTVRVRG